MVTSVSICAQNHYALKKDIYSHVKIKTITSSGNPNFKIMKKNGMVFGKMVDIGFICKDSDIDYEIKDINTLDKKSVTQSILKSSKNISRCFTSGLLLKDYDVYEDENNDYEDEE